MTSQSPSNDERSDDFDGDDHFSARKKIRVKAQDGYFDEWECDEIEDFTYVDTLDGYISAPRILHKNKKRTRLTYLQQFDQIWGRDDLNMFPESDCGACSARNQQVVLWIQNNHQQDVPPIILPENTHTPKRPPIAK